MGDLDEGQERITLALYGGALAAIGVLLVAFLFYVQSALPLIRDLSATLSSPPPEEIVATDANGTTTTIPAITTEPEGQAGATGADPATQIRLIVASTALGAALVGWALAASAWRGIGAAIGIHLAALVASFPLAEPLADPIWSLGFLLLVICLTIAAALALRATLTLPQRALQCGLIVACTPLALLLSVRTGWWIIPLAWVALPIVGAVASANVGNTASEQAA